MLTSGYNPNRISTSPNGATIDSVNGADYAIGASYIALKLLVPSVVLVFKITYVAPMAGSLGTFGRDDLAELIFQISVTGSTLHLPAPIRQWSPGCLLKDGLLYFTNLPAGRIELESIDPSDATKTLDYLYFQSVNTNLRMAPGQLPGVGPTVTPSQLAEALYQATVSPNLADSVSCASAVVKSILRWGYLPASIPRIASQIDPTVDGELDIGANLTCAVYLLYLLKDWRARPNAQQLDTGLTEDLILAIITIANLAKSALDLRTGLVFANLTFKVYRLPSYIATSLALILWHELSSSFERSEYLVAVARTWEAYGKLTYNVKLESLAAYNFANLILGEYRSLEQLTNPQLVTTELFDCSSIEPRYIPLAAMLPNITLGSDPLPQRLPIPRMATTTFDARLATYVLGRAIALQTQLKMMPYGYLWPTHEQLASRSSIWGAFYQATAQSVASSLLVQRAKANQTNEIVRSVLFERPSQTPTEYWQELAIAYFKSPRFSKGCAEWVAYLSGLNPITSTLVDYQYTQIPASLVAVTLPALTTVGLNKADAYQPPDVVNLYPLDLKAPLFEPTQSAVPLGLLAGFLATDLLATNNAYHQVDLSPRTNQIKLYGEGKPVAIVGRLKDRLMVGVIYSVYFHTWDGASGVYTLPASGFVISTLIAAPLPPPPLTVVKPISTTFIKKIIPAVVVKSISTTFIKKIIPAVVVKPISTTFIYTLVPIIPTANTQLIVRGITGLSSNTQLISSVQKTLPTATTQLTTRPLATPPTSTTQTIVVPPPP